MGTWEGKHEGEPVEFSFMEKNIWVLKTHDVTMAGTWTIDLEGNAQITSEDGDQKTIATLMNDGKIIAREVGGSNAIVFEKSDSKKK